MLPRFVSVMPRPAAVLTEVEAHAQSIFPDWVVASCTLLMKGVKTSVLVEIWGVFAPYTIVMTPSPAAPAGGVALIATLDTYLVAINAPFQAAPPVATPAMSLD